MPRIEIEVYVRRNLIEPGNKVAASMPIKVFLPKVFEAEFGRDLDEARQKYVLAKLVFEGE